MCIACELHFPNLQDWRTGAGRTAFRRGPTGATSPFAAIEVSPQEQRNTIDQADCVIRAGAIHAMDQAGRTYRAIALRNGKIVALGAESHDLDGLLKPNVRVIDDASLTLFPGFIDTHTHLIFAGRAADDVPVEKAKNEAEFVDLIRQRAAATPKGQWIRTSAAWNESNLAEKRMPLAHVLDQATTEHPVLVKRGGHNDVLNTLGMQLAGLTRDTPTPKGGTIWRDETGAPTGWLSDAAISIAENVFPKPTVEGQLAGLRKASRDYAAHGLCTVKDAFVSHDEIALLQRAAVEGALAVRVRAMLGVAFAAESAADVAAEIDGWELPADAPEGILSFWGLKFVIDGGAENSATDQPYANRPDFNGQLMWAADALVAAVTQAARRGLRVGIHAWGDRAVRTVLDVYEKVLHDVGNVPMGNLVLEHGGLALPEQRARAIKLGIPVTVQHPLLHELAPLILENWGRARTEQIFPLREWLAEGALLAAGSDYPVGPYDAMRSISGMVTRQTRAGILGPEHAIDVATAIRLYTSDAARLMQEEASLGSLEPGKRADIVAYPRDPMTVPAEELGELAPVFTLVGGRAMHDPTGRFE